MREEPSKLLILLGVPVCRSISPKSPLWHDRQADFSDEPQTLHSVGCAGLPGHSGATGKLSVCHSSPPYKGEVAQPGAMHRRHVTPEGIVDDERAAFPA